MDMCYIVGLNLFVCVLFTVQDLNENSEKNADEDEAFQETEWVDITDGYNGRLQKKVNMTLLLTTF